ncbi:MAG: hypothetical protein RL065_1526 [Bacteroidota bacterium]
MVYAELGSAQNINYSLPEKNVSKNYDFAVLGKTTEGIIIYKFNKNENVIQCYDNAMNLKWFKEAQLNNKNSNIQHISVHNNKIYVFFSYKKGDAVIIAAQKFSPKLEPDGRIKIIDSVSKDIIGDADDWYVKHSEDKTKYMVYYVTKESKETTEVQSILITDRFKIIKRSHSALPEAKDNLTEELMDNDGNFYFLVAEQEHSDLVYKTIFTNVRFYKLSVDGLLSENRFLSSSKIRLNSTIVKVDNINKTLLLVGIAKQKGNNNTPGFLVSKWNLKKDSAELQKFDPYSDETIKDMMYSPESDYNNFEIKDLVVKFDGGFVAITENIYATQQTIEVPNYYSPSFPSVRTYTYTHKDDVFVQSFDASANSQWHKLIRKKQSSESEDSPYSSYGLLKGKSTVQLLFNESINEQSNLFLQTITSDGAISRGGINSSRQKNLMLMPEKACQVSLYEIIIPSQFRGYTQFVKIDF